MLPLVERFSRDLLDKVFIHLFIYESIIIILKACTFQIISLGIRAFLQKLKLQKMMYLKSLLFHKNSRKVLELSDFCSQPDGYMEEAGCRIGISISGVII